MGSMWSEVNWIGEVGLSGIHTKSSDRKKKLIKLNSLKCYFGQQFFSWKCARITAKQTRFHEFTRRDLDKMYKCISLWLIVLTIIMTFCVSHQKQLDDDPASDANRLIKDDTTRNYHHNNESADNAESISLGEHETQFRWWHRIVAPVLLCGCLRIDLIIAEIFPSSRCVSTLRRSLAMSLSCYVTNKLFIYFGV